LDNWKAKEFELSQQDISCSSSHVTPTIGPSFDASPFLSNALGLTNVFSPLIVDVHPPTLNSVKDFIGNGSVHFASSDISPILEIAFSASSSIEFLDADAVRRLPVALYAPMHALPNVLPFHNNMTYSANDKPTPDIVSTLLRIGSSLYAIQSSSASFSPIF
jgi:hypothetical protein